MPTAPLCTILKIQDISNNGDARDLMAHFYFPFVQTNVSEYRVFIVPESDVGLFTLSVASAISDTTFYTSILSEYGNGILRNVSYLSTSKDYSGNVITAGVSYVSFVLSVGRNGYDNGITLPSNALTLVTNCAAPNSGVTKMYDIGNNGNASDIRITFREPTFNSNIAYYKVCVAPTSDIATITGDFILSLTSPKFVSATKGISGSFHTVDLTSTIQDVNGNAIANGISYNAIIQSVGLDGVSSFSISDFPLTLTNNVPAATYLSRADVSNFNDARDIQYGFTSATDETNIYEYRIFVSTLAEYTAFTQSMASSLSSDFYVSVPKSGNGVQHVLTLSQYLTTISGEPIVNGTSYMIFVLSVAQNGYTDTLSSTSSIYAVELTDTPISVNVIQPSVVSSITLQNPSIQSGTTVVVDVVTAEIQTVSPYVSNSVVNLSDYELGYQLGLNTGYSKPLSTKVEYESSTVSVSTDFKNGFLIGVIVASRSPVPLEPTWNFIIVIVSYDDSAPKLTISSYNPKEPDQRDPYLYGNINERMFGKLIITGDERGVTYSWIIDEIANEYPLNSPIIEGRIWLQVISADYADILDQVGFTLDIENNSPFQIVYYTWQDPIDNPRFIIGEVTGSGELLNAWQVTDVEEYYDPPGVLHPRVWHWEYQTITTI